MVNVRYFTTCLNDFHRKASENSTTFFSHLRGPEKWADDLLASASNLGACQVGGQIKPTRFESGF